MKSIETILSEFSGRESHNSLKRFKKDARKVYRPIYNEEQERIMRSDRTFLISLKVFESSGGNPAVFPQFWDLYNEAVHANRIARDKNTDEKSKKEAYARKYQSCIGLLIYRREGISCVIAELEYDKKKLDRLETSYMLLTVDLARRSSFHLPYPRFADQCRQRGYQDPMDLIGNWDRTVRGFRFKR